VKEGKLIFNITIVGDFIDMVGSMDRRGEFDIVISEGGSFTSGRVINITKMRTSTEFNNIIQFNGLIVIQDSFW